jgi:mRNA interferase MazF
VNIGSEQDGHNELYERPVLILRGFSTQLFWGVPISTKIKRGNQYYYSFAYDGHGYSAIISGLRVSGNKRLVRKLYVMPHSDFVAIRGKVSRELMREH